MGGRTIQTPNLDRMAAEGVRFNNLFAGSSVCAPTRCCLMTGKHGGHASIRANGGGTPLRADEVTVASLLNYNNMQVVINLLGKSDANTSVAASLAAILLAFVLLLGLSLVGGSRRRTGKGVS